MRRDITSGCLRDAVRTRWTFGESVYALADAGSSSDEIARQLDEHIGKVELILALREA